MEFCCADTKFNVVVFGSSWQFMSPKCQDYTEETAAAAVAWIQTNVHANWGGTEIAGTLQAIYQTPISDGVAHDHWDPAQSQPGSRFLLSHSRQSHLVVHELLAHGGPPRNRGDVCDDMNTCLFAQGTHARFCS